MRETFLGPVVLPDEDVLRDLLLKVRSETGIPAIGAVGSVAGARSSAFVGTAVSTTNLGLSHRSRFEMSCLIKLFSSLLAHELAANKKFDLCAPVHSYLPELARESEKSEMLVAHLMSHTSGYRGLDITDARTKWAYTWDRFVDHFHSHGMSFVPGAVFNYEHSEHVILGEIISKLCGRTVQELIISRIFEPLGIRLGRASEDRRAGDSFVEQRRYDAASSAFVGLPSAKFGDFWAASLPDLTISLADLVCAIEAIIDSLGARSPLLNFPNLILGMTEKTIALPAQFQAGRRVERRPYAFSQMCGLYGRGFMGHNGSMPGQTCAVRFRLEDRVVLAVGVAAFAPYARDLAIERIIDCFSDKTAQSNICLQDRFTMKSLSAGFSIAEITGRYCGSFYSQIEVFPEGNNLVFMVGNSSSSRMKIVASPTVDGLYRLRAPVATSLAFLRENHSEHPILTMNMHAYRKL